MQTLLTDILGTVGSWMLALCALPAAYSAWKTKEAHYNRPFLLLWFWGEVLLLWYTILTGQLLLIPNYVLNIVAIGIIWRYNVYRAK